MEAKCWAYNDAERNLRQVRDGCGYRTGLHRVR